jgi:hypothetical protein
MKKYRLIIEPDGIGGYFVGVTDNTRRGETILEINAKDYAEAQKKVHFEKNTNGKLTII